MTGPLAWVTQEGEPPWHRLEPHHAQRGPSAPRREEFHRGPGTQAKEGLPGTGQWPTDRVRSPRGVRERPPAWKGPGIYTSFGFCGRLLIIVRKEWNERLGLSSAWAARSSSSSVRGGGEP